MKQKFSFSKGMRQSISPNKADPQSYYEALNKRVVVDNKSGTAALTDEPGTKLLASIPDTRPVYTIELDPSEIAINATLTFYTELGNSAIALNCTSDIDLVYSLLNAETALELLVNGGNLFFGIKGNKITIVYLDDNSGGLTITGTGLILSTVVPSITDAEIIAHATIRNQLILFTRSGTYGQIWKCNYDSSGNITLNPAYNLVYNNVMYPSLTEDYQIYDVVGRWDNEDLVKIYWSNTVDELNHINITSKESLILPMELLSITPDCTFTQPKINGTVTGGLYKAGVVQYGYQLYNLNGAETIISPLSGLVHLTDSNDSVSSSFSYKGTPNGEDSGKAVSVTIDNIDSKYDFIKIIAVYYTSEEGEPEVNVVFEGNVPTSESLTIIDGGDTVLSVYTPAQLNSIGTRIFSPKLLTTKDNYLIAGNFTDKYFDIDEELGYYWDARTYRFKAGVDNSAKIKYVGESAYTTVDTSFLIGGEAVPEQHDCHLEKNEQYTNKYQTGGTILGGAGSKIQYDFFTRPLLIDNLSDEKHVITPQSSNRQKWGDSTNVDFIEEGYSDNNSFTNYASPVNQAEVVGYQRDEVYRFGIIFFDGKGRQSFVKWIGDIKMPAIHEINANYFYYANQDSQTDAVQYPDIFFKCTGGTGIYANALGVRFIVDTTGLPVDWSFAIVRARREDIDKTIIAQGTPVPGSWNNHYSFVQPSYTYELSPISAYDGASGYKGLLYFYSPEFKFDKTFKRTSTDNLKFITEFEPDLYFIPSGQEGEFSKFYKIGTVNNRISTVNREVEDSIYTDVNASTVYTLSIAGSSTRICNYGFGTTAGVNDDDRMCYVGSNLALGLTSTNVLGITNNVIVNYTRELVTQYGGFNYIAKQNTSYILAGKIRRCNGSYVDSYVYGGDTFIECYDFLQTMLDSENNIPIDGLKHKSVIYLPVETSINLALRHDTCPSKNTFAATSSKLQETIEKGFQVWPEGNAFGAYPSNLTDLYLYNSVYSKQPTGKVYVAKPFNFSNVEVNDCVATSSERSISGELVDSWTKFLFNNTIRVNSANGALSKLHVFRNQVMFWQDRAFGIFSFNDRKVLNDPNGTQLILGVGSVLEYYQYISEMSGTKFTRSVVDSGAALYWYDHLNHKMMMSQGGKEESISDIADVAPLFKKPEFDNPYDVISIFDKSSRRIIHSFKGYDLNESGLIPQPTFGALYNRFVIEGTGDSSIIPEDMETLGWRIPTLEDGEDLLSTTIGYDYTTLVFPNISPDSGGQLSRDGELYWYSSYPKPNNFRFNATGCGNRLSTGTYANKLIGSKIWLNSPSYLGGANYPTLTIMNDNIVSSHEQANTGPKQEGNSLRVVRDATSNELLLPNGSYCGIYTDTSGFNYDIVKIGNLVWSAYPLITMSLRDGTEIPDVTDNGDWTALTTGALCYYNNDIWGSLVLYPNPSMIKTVAFNERLQAFESLYTYVPKMYLPFDGNMLAVSYQYPGIVFEHNYENTPNEFYGQVPAEGYVTITAGGDEKKVFTNVEFNSVSSDGTTEYPLDTFDSIELENSYASATVALTQPTNLRRRFRTWRIQLPKDIEGVRYMDTYLRLKLINTPENNANLRLEDVTLYYLIPML